MKYFSMLLTTLVVLACAPNQSESENWASSSERSSCSISGNSSAISSSSSESRDSSRIWIVEGLLGVGPVVRFSYFPNDTSWLEYKATNLKQDSIYKMSGWLSWHSAGNFDFPDSAFLRGDTIQYRLAYTLDGKLDSTAWQEYVFLGNHTQLIFGKDTTLIQQFDSIQYPIVLGPKDSCGRALMSSILTYSVVDTFDYESNWDALFSDGREYISDYDPFCHGDPQFKMAFFTLISYKGDINDAAKAIQKVNPRFFITLTPWCEELTACETVQNQ